MLYQLSYFRIRLFYSYRSLTIFCWMFLAKVSFHFIPWGKVMLYQLSYFRIRLFIAISDCKDSGSFVSDKEIESKFQQTDYFFEILSIDFIEKSFLITVNIEYSDHLLIVDNRHNNFGFR